MSRRRVAPTSGWAVWTFVVALLLKAAVPMLATAAAYVQGKALVEVCSVYGVRTVVLDSDGRPAPSDPAAGQHGDHCALSGLLALAVAEPAPPLRLAALALADASCVARDPVPARDACASWIARLKRGPPSLS